ncbi:MarR family winged helix-turn-helix transcriptional regulator [Rhizobium rhizogenes]|uniref:MarR family winged helix-turn-helix transcriptional regulator n=1 Tax=Rhizobium rhizogenes TaxID=359 RepID=UPI001571C009|nr:MarR family transcriptional regulator [Rhizobium rhizogenes]
MDAPDETDLIQQEWALARPDLPVRSIGVITRIWQIAKLLTDDRRRTMNQLGMEPAIRDLLANLRRSGAPYRLRVSELAVRCRVSKGAITQRVERAEAAGLVRCTSSREMTTGGRRWSPSSADGDQRAVWIDLTPQGKEQVEATVEALLRHEDTLVADLSGEEIAALANTLRRLLYHLEKCEGKDIKTREESDF